MIKDNHQIFRHPLSRIGTIDLGQIGLRKHHIAGLLEVDVTDALNQIEMQRSKGRPVSFFAWMVKTISTVISEHRYIHAVMGPRHSTVVFEDIDISVIVERVVQGKRVPLPLVIRKTNVKTVEDIYAEIQAAQRQDIRDERDFVLKENRLSRSAMRLYYMLPQRMRLILLDRILKNPFRYKKTMGTAIITSVGSVAYLPGWVIPKAMHNLCFALGSVVKKPWVVRNKVEIRDILHLTVLFDHDVVDGAP
ncbi:MAG TPA: 2-oxo acid dehydrogenase subunit E2, partial [Methanoregula sp.]|nr:2-oxo acid dehydrogenase subunit E2 [Methanoregula sp.]